MKTSLRTAAARLAAGIAEHKAAGGTDWQKFARSAVRDLTPAQRRAIAYSNEHFFQSLLQSASSAMST